MYANLRLHGQQAHLVQILDDLHWADEGTQRLLRFVTTEFAREPVFVLGTSRPLPETIPIQPCAF